MDEFEACVDAAEAMSEGVASPEVDAILAAIKERADLQEFRSLGLGYILGLSDALGLVIDVQNPEPIEVRLVTAAEAAQIRAEAMDADSVTVADFIEGENRGADA